MLSDNETLTYTLVIDAYANDLRIGDRLVFNFEHRTGPPITEVIHEGEDFRKTVRIKTVNGGERTHLAGEVVFIARPADPAHCDAWKFTGVPVADLIQPTQS